MSGTKTVLVPLAEGFEEVEAITIIDVLRRSGLKVTTTSLANENLLVKGAHGINVEADANLKDFNETIFDAVVLPGGMPGTTNLLDSSLISSILKMHNDQNKIVAAICAAPWVLFEAGVLNEKQATCYPGFEEKLKKNVTIKYDNVVTSDNIITSRGPGTAFDFSLTIVEDLLGNNVANKISEQILYKNNSR